VSEIRNPGPDLQTQLENGDVEAALYAIHGLSGEQDARIFHEVAALTNTGITISSGDKIADLAATGLIESLGLKPSFGKKPSGVGYSSDELAEVRKLVIDNVPQ